MLRVTALAALAALAGCGPIEDSCANGTVVAAVTLSGTLQADELVVDVALDDGAARESSLAHTPGSAAGNVVVQFPSGYPRGHKLTVTVTARAAGAVLGQGSASVALADRCEAVTLTVAPVAADDLGSADDLADGGGSDGGAVADLARCVPQPESCFNGIDDDCDGLVDCADPDCTTLAVCVPPVTAPFVVGSTLDDPKSLCPASYTQLEVVGSGPIDNGCINSTCSCAMVCHTQLGSFGNAGNCPNTDNENQLAVLNNQTCASWNAWDGTMDLHQLVTPASCSASGTTTVSMPQWAASKEFCSTALHGGGCSSGDWCVPATPGARCEVAAGAHSCDPGYNAVGGTWYTGFSDTRSCGCSCGAATGNCGTNVTLYSDKSCSMNAASFTATGTNNINCSVAGPYLSGKINVSPTGACAAGGGATESGSLGGSGQQTLCCAP